MFLSTLDDLFDSMNKVFYNKQTFAKMVSNYFSSNKHEMIMR